jgi:transposase-like protein
MRDVESLCEQAGLGKLSKSTAARICSELRERFEAFQRRDLYDVQLAALFLHRRAEPARDQVAPERQPVLVRLAHP